MSSSSTGMNGLRCFADSTVGLLKTSPKEFRFKFQSFVFAKLGDTVFIHYTVVVCKMDETTKTCSNVSDHDEYLFRPHI